MKKNEKSAMAVAIAIIMLAALLLPAFTGRIIYPFQQQIQQQIAAEFNQQVQSAQQAALPGEMIAIKEVSIEPLLLEKMNEQPQLKQPVIVCFKEKTVEEKIAEALKKALPIAATTSTTAATISIPFPFSPVEKQQELQKIAVEKEAIKALQQELVKIPVANLEITKNLHNIPCSIAKMDRQAVQQAYAQKLQINIMEDVAYSPHILEAIALTGVDKVTRRQVGGQNIQGKGIVVAIIDSGIDYRHPDLGGCFGPGCKVVDGWNFVDNSTNVIDEEGHGTHLAGIIASIAPEASLIALKVCKKTNGETLCFSSKIAEALDWCLDYGCSIATLSLGDQKAYNPEECTKVETLKTILKTASSRGLVLFVSSGNSGLLWPAYPACDPHVISVGSIDDVNGEISEFSNRHADIFAPGELIVSTWLNNSYNGMVGTSQAAAFAAGVAVLYMQTYSAVKKTTPTALLLEEQFETMSSTVYDPLTNKSYPSTNALRLIESLIGTEALSFVCNNSICEFWVGEDAQNCVADCFTNVTNISLKNYSLSFEIRDWQNRITPTRIEIRNNLLKDFNYPDLGTEALPIELQEGGYDIKISHGLFSAVLRAINISSSTKLKAKLEDLTTKIKRLPQFPYVQVKTVYALGFENNASAIVCFDRQLATNNSFVFKCSWNNGCIDGWSVVMSMKPQETSCILTALGKGVAFAVAEIPEAVCGNGICEQRETESCPSDCELKPFGEEKVEKAKQLLQWLQKFWPPILIAAIAVLLIAIGIALARKKKERLKHFIPSPPPPT